MKKITTLALLLALVLGLSACNDDDERDTTSFLINGTLIRTPSGGADFGFVTIFDTKTNAASIASRYDADGYDFDLDTISQVMISVESLDGLNPLVELYDHNGQFVAGDDESGIGSDALLVGTLNPGFYTILVWSSLQGGNTSGDYEINVLFGDANGGDFETLAINQSKSENNNTLDSNGGSATWIVTLEAPSQLTVDVTQTSGAADILLQIIDQRGNIVDMIDPVGLNDPLYVGDLARGTYTIVLDNADTAAAGTYDLAVSAAAQGAP